MKPWKAVLGLGIACAACCAVPLLGVAGGLGAAGSVLLACVGELLPPAAALLAIALAVAWWWRRRQASRNAACGCASACATKAPHAGH